MAYRRRQQEQQQQQQRQQQQRHSSISSNPTTTTSNSFTNSNSSRRRSACQDDDDYYKNIYDTKEERASTTATATSLAAKAITASSAHRDSSLSSAYSFNHKPIPKESKPFDFEYTTSTSSSVKSSITSTNYSNSKEKDYKHGGGGGGGFWGNLARKAKSLLDDDADNYNPQPPPPPNNKYPSSHPSYHTHNRTTDSPKLQRGINAISSSLNYIGNAVEEGITKMENRTAGIIQETRKHIKKKHPTDTNSAAASHYNPPNTTATPWEQSQPQPPMQTDIELQLKASRDVAMAMAAKAKLLLRELKTVKADFAFAKERCAQLEEENKILRESRTRGDNPEDDDLIRLQLESLLAEKARLAHENSVYARENRFLREVVEYHQLTMQDVVYLDEGTEEVTEVYPIKVVSNIQSANPASSPRSVSADASLDTSTPVFHDLCLRPVPPPGLVDVPQSPTTIAADTRKHTTSSI